MGISLPLVDQELAPVWIHSNDEAADSGLDDVSPEVNRAIPKSRDLGLKPSDLESRERAANRNRMIHVRLGDDKGGITDVILDPLFVARGARSTKNHVKKLARRSNITDGIRDERQPGDHEVKRCGLSI